MPSKQTRVDALKDEIARLEREREQLEHWNKDVRALNSFSSDEKIAVFDKLYARAFEYVETSVRDGRKPKDAKSYLFEDVVELMLGVKVWGILRQI